jgi:hypothetical protein
VIAIAAGSQVAIILQGQSTLLKCDKEVIAEMTPFLSNFNLAVLQSDIQSEDFGAYSCLYPGNFTATIMLQPGTDTDDSSINSEVSQAYSLVTRASPIAISVPSVNGQPTGQPTGGGGTSSDAVSSATDAISEFFKNLKSTGTAILVGLAAVIIIVLLIAAFGPNAGAIARAV